MNRLLIVLCAGMLAACAVGYNPRYYFNEIQVVNLAGAPVTDLSLRVAGSAKTLGCAEVGPFAMCADRFGRRPYPQQGIEVAWTHPGGNRKTETHNPHIPAFFSTGFPLRVVLEINQDGSVRVFYEQDEPGGNRIFDFGSL